MDQYEDSFDDILAKMEMPEDPKFEHQLAEGSSKTENFKEPEPNKTKYANAIQVNPKQRGNPILKSITNIPYEFNDQILADYIVGKTAAVLYLSVRYHNLKPDYIHERLKQLGKNYELRVLLVHVDVKESQNALKHLTRVCLLANLTLMLAWSSEEAGKIIETYKMFENRPPDFIMEKVESDKYHSVSKFLLYFEFKTNR